MLALSEGKINVIPTPATQIGPIKQSQGGYPLQVGQARSDSIEHAYPSIRLDKSNVNVYCLFLKCSKSFEDVSIHMDSIVATIICLGELSLGACPESNRASITVPVTGRKHIWLILDTNPVASRR